MRFPTFFGIGALLNSLVSAAGIDKVVAFGDSLTDHGNAARLTSKTGPVIPSDAYYKKRFTNGLTYLDYITRKYRIPQYNFAVGGATTSDALIQGTLGGKFGEPLRSDGSVLKVPGVDNQIKAFIAKNQAKLAQKKFKNALFVIWSGGNDKFNDAILGLNKGGAFYAEAQYKNWETLAKAGVTNIVNIKPAVQSEFDGQFSAQLDVLGAKFQAAYPAVKFRLHDTSPRILDIVANNSKYGFKVNVNEGFCCVDCVTGLPPKGKAVVCKNPNEYTLWDGLHPTAAVHKLLGMDLEKFIVDTWGIKKRAF
ncbi:hypothetical protein HDU97_002673 [Phlyctochytrium planicorne]|nr:hypothetical protein HDU97_002673 [Phlyctochytrium planicorne]